MNSDIKKLELLFVNPEQFGNPEQLAAYGKKHKTLQKESKDLEQEWEQLSSELEIITTELQQLKLLFAGPKNI